MLLIKVKLYLKIINLKETILILWKVLKINIIKIVNYKKNEINKNKDNLYIKV